MLEWLSQQPAVRWARTSCNGWVTATKQVGSGVQLQTSRGNLNDRTLFRATSDAGGLDIDQKVFSHHTAVRLGTTTKQGKKSDLAAMEESFVLANGRQLPHLLFVTSKARLQNRIGADGMAQVVQMIAAAGQELLDVQGSDYQSCSGEILAALQNHPGLYQGVVLIGGHMVVPFARVDTFDHTGVQDPDGQRKSDIDHFIVWSDDVYADPDGKGPLGLPVSRIPDGKSSELVLKALATPDTQMTQIPFGIYNMHRPFAHKVFKLIDPNAQLEASGPIFHSQIPYDRFQAQRVYIMLHGTDFDGKLYLGEMTDGSQKKTVALMNIQGSAGQVVFTGCCWGSLLSGKKARVDSPIIDRTPDELIGLKFLMEGARAFVGCSGTHYSSDRADVFDFAIPIHHYFWTYFQQGEVPAVALFRAKQKYQQEFVEQFRFDPMRRNIYRKCMWQYSCLGLGW
ncbi:hypothetical protein [Deinococcus cellulosilyticus]|uniref:hypothetical protein n=1 Tax=Deinococcus cellulosilyticus TaxID=401558 RepID=UPI001FE99D27|nr:hypothetical protein [Deinococcus cellulosilyticus]